MEKKTPLYDCHLAAGGKMVPFAGYSLPIQYEDGGIIKEHLAVRQQAGLFDVSHMGEFLLSGPDALSNLQNLLTNDFTSLKVGFARYSPMCYENGGVVDDLLVYRLDEQQYLAVVNAANRDKDWAWMQKNLSGQAKLEDISDTLAQMALQGPQAEAVLQKLNTADIPAKNYSFTAKAQVAGIECLLSRTGYTGEDGFELYCAAEQAAALWQALLDAGAELGLRPCGLGARDTLRMEAGMPLYGHEMDENTSPVEAGLEFFIKPDKPDFLGKAALVAQAAQPHRRRIGLAVTGRGIVRELCPLLREGRPVGQTTSGTMSPFFNKALAMALVEDGCQEIGQRLTADVRGRLVELEVVELPFYKRQK